VPTVATFVFFVGDEGREAAEVVGGGGFRNGDDDVAIEREAFGLREVLERIPVLGVRG